MVLMPIHPHAQEAIPTMTENDNQVASLLLASFSRKKRVIINKTEKNQDSKGYVESVKEKRKTEKASPTPNVYL